MTYDFDVPITRRGTGCIKYDRRPELDPFWVADMDFASAPAILEALHRRVDHGIFGYAQAHEGLNEAIDRLPARPARSDGSAASRSSTSADWCPRSPSPAARSASRARR